MNPPAEALQILETATYSERVRRKLADLTPLVWMLLVPKGF